MTGLRLSEVVLRTTIYDHLCDFYSLLLAQPRTVEMTPPPSDDPDEPSRISFFDFYFAPPYTQRIAIFECKDIGPGPTSKGLHHFQLRTPHHRGARRPVQRTQGQRAPTAQGVPPRSRDELLLPPPRPQSDRTVLADLLLARP